MAQTVHNLGLPGVSFMDEVRRTYPSGRLGGHVIGRVDIDNRGTAGIERYIDETGASEEAIGARLSARAPVRLSLDMGVMHAVDDELAGAMKRYGASGAAGLVMDVNTGEIVASVSRPGVDPAIVEEGLDPKRIDKVLAGTYELGSIMKLVTIAMALEDGKTLDTMVDTTAPLTVGRHTIADLHPLGRPMTVAEVFVHSSNVGSGQLALAAGLISALSASVGLAAATSSVSSPRCRTWFCRSTLPLNSSGSPPAARSKATRFRSGRVEATSPLPPLCFNWSAISAKEAL
jgi:cell division protein FtsI (penicillin-binding protein 3)